MIMIMMMKTKKMTTKMIRPIGAIHFLLTEILHSRKKFSTRNKNFLNPQRNQLVYQEIWFFCNCAEFEAHSPVKWRCLAIKMSFSFSARKNKEIFSNKWLIAHVTPLPVSLSVFLCFYLFHWLCLCLYFYLSLSFSFTKGCFNRAKPDSNAMQWSFYRFRFETETSV